MVPARCRDHGYQRRSEPVRRAALQVAERSLDRPRGNHRRDLDAFGGAHESLQHPVVVRRAARGTASADTIGHVASGVVTVNLPRGATSRRPRGPCSSPPRWPVSRADWSCPSEPVRRVVVSWRLGTGPRTRWSRSRAQPHPPPAVDRVSPGGSQRARELVRFLRRRSPMPWGR